jgi:hypothetical protein
MVQKSIHFGNSYSLFAYAFFLPLQIVRNHLEALTDPQLMAIYNLQHSSQQAEDALSQGMEALQQSLTETLSSTSIGSGNVAEYMGQMAIAMTKLATLETFIHQVVNFIHVIFSWSLDIYLILQLIN